VKEKKPTPPSSAGGAGPAGGSVASCPAPTKPGSKIILKGTPEEKKRLEEILDKIRETEAGRKLLSDIDNAKNPVEFQLGEAKASGGGVTRFTGGLNGPVSNGTGTQTTVIIDKDLKDGSLYVFDKSGNKIADPVDVVAAHELTHALHCANGTIDTADPERQAITGENAIRNERTPKLTERDPGNHGGGYY
jgi:Effector protein